MTRPTEQLWDFLQSFGLEEAERRLRAVVEPRGENECWPCAVNWDAKGYKRLKIGQRAILAHRFAWTLANKKDPGALIICHRCDVPVCCNPAHLFLGTYRDNTLDMIAKGRHRRGRKLPEVRQNVRYPVRRHEKLTLAQRQAIALDPRTGAVIAQQYGISTAQAYRLKRGESSGNSNSRTSLSRGAGDGGCDLTVPGASVDLLHEAGNSQ